MSERVTMPALGESVTEGTVTRWLKNVGDHVDVDEPLLEVSTDKVDTEIPSPVAGTLQEILAGEDDTVPVGADLAVIGDGDAAPSSDGDSGAAQGDQRGDLGAQGQAPAEPQQQTEQAAERAEPSTEASEPQPAPDASQGQSQSPGPESAPQPPGQQPAAQDEGQPQADHGQSQGDQGQAQGDQGQSPGDQSQSQGDQSQSQGDQSQSQGDQSQSQGAQAPSAPQQGSGSGSSDGTKVTMPALGESVTEGTITRWLKSEGDQVAVDEPLLEVSTDKVDTEIPSPVAGTLTQILVAEDETVPVGADLAIVGGSGAPSADPGEASGAEPAAAEQSAPDSSEPQVEEAAPQQQDQPPTPSQPAADAQQPEEGPSTVSQPAPAPATKDQGPGQEGSQDQAAGTRSADQQGPEAQGVDRQGSDQKVSAQGAGDAGGQGDASAYVTPLVRKLATDHGIELASLTGTGIGGRIRKQDILDAAAAANAATEQPAPAAQGAAAPSGPGGAAAPAPGGSGSQGPDARRGTTEKMSRLRQTIAKRMVESLQISAQLTTVVEVDVTKIARLRARAKGEFERREGTKLSFLPFFALAAVEALKVFPTVNASVDGDQVTYHGAEHLGIAVDTERGLLVPVIRDAGDLNIAGLSRKIADLADRTRMSKITPDELGGGTFTLTNTGSRGALFDTPIINQPQVAILGTGAVVKRPIVVTDTEGGETIAIRSMAYLALSYDHRIVDGADAARFLTAMKARLEEGAFEASLGL